MIYDLRLTTCAETLLASSFALRISDLGFRSRLLMSFLNPIMLFGLAAVSIPIIIHLLNRRKFRRVVWAAMRFLQLSVEQNQKRMRIEDLILLVLRCLLLILIALALARPAWRTVATDIFG